MAGRSAPSKALAATIPIQKAFHEQHGLQCGFCTPGMMMAAVDLLRDNP